MARRPTTKGPKSVEALTHEKAKRTNIPTAEHQSLAQRLEEMHPAKPVHYPRPHSLSAGAVRERDPDLDPQIIWNGARIRLSPAQVRQLQEKGEVEIGDAQLVWRGKDQQDWSDLVVNTPQIFIQEKVHPKAIIDDLVRRSREAKAKDEAMPDLFADFNGLTDPEARTEFYQHSQHWSNRMVLGDSLQVMASLAEREHLRGQVQCIYFDPPYGIKFNSNWQVSTLSRDVKDGKQTDISREPEQVKAFRDTWKDGIHSYLTYLRDRLTVARDLLHESGSIFVQIGDENVHRVRALMDEVFGDTNFISLISIKKSSAQTSSLLTGSNDYLCWYARRIDLVKYRKLFIEKGFDTDAGSEYRFALTKKRERVPINIEYLTGALPLPPELRPFRPSPLTSQGYRTNTTVSFSFEGKEYHPGITANWKTTIEGMNRLVKADRIIARDKSLSYLRLNDDHPVFTINNVWEDTKWGFDARDKTYVVQTNTKVLQRCILMTTDPGDLVLDPTCGSGTTGAVAEQWGRRWIMIDTSRVALALARTRLIAARYAYYYLKDSKEGRAKEQEVSAKVQPDTPMHSDIRQGFVYERVPHIMLKDIAHNAEIDVIWEIFQQKLQPLRAELNAALEQSWEEWQIPRVADEEWPAPAKKLHASWWEARIERQRQIDASITKAADVEMLYDRPYEDKSRARVAGPFTVESLSPHRVVPADEEELIDIVHATEGKHRRSKMASPPTDFADMVLEHLRTAGVHQAEKRDTIMFTSLTGWPGEYIGAEGRFIEKNGSEHERRAAIFIGPEFGTLSRVDLTAAAREATDARFDVLIACAFNFDAHASELTRLGPLPILKAKMNPDLHMAGELKNTGKGNLFVVFGEPDIDILDQGNDTLVVKVNGVDVFDPNTGQIRSNDVKGIAAWFIDTDYNEESFFVRHAYFLGANDPYKSLKTALRAEIDEDAWATLYRDTSRPFPRPNTGRIAVKVINHFGDEVMKVFRV
ncbi:site-specific DNA-methyltransferase [Rhodomicrobium vannielii ATCC 17100]|uniref:site-specific DNA-methyltransferase n=1 Tax=Rhodomicrobium vannielii TaxID=1069 RepID=UPI00191B1671|nr:site-specific DNA-methyltransferase [Rhodomicrobium vannielii]MBJ7533251.1 site-specific DNA-methyltransferase [Rhodomicrobium vannielii ATCC 17100]